MVDGSDTSVGKGDEDEGLRAAAGASTGNARRAAPPAEDSVGNYTTGARPASAERMMRTADERADGSDGMESEGDEARAAGGQVGEAVGRLVTIPPNFAQFACSAGASGAGAGGRVRRMAAPRPGTLSDAVTKVRWR